MSESEITDREITTAMAALGGGFVYQLAVLYRMADPVNQAKLRECFSAYWQEYRDLALLHKAGALKGQG